MRILHLTSHLNVGGVTNSVLTVAGGLRARGHEVIIASDGGELERSVSALGATHWRLPLHTSAEFSPQVWRAGRRVMARARAHPVDLIHAHTRVAQVLAQRLSRYLQVPYIATWHGFFRPGVGRRLWPCTGDLTIAISEPVRQHLLRDFHVPSDRIRLILHGIDTASFEAPVDRATQAQLRARAGLNRHGPIVGTIARLVASKHVEDFIRCVPRLRADAPSVQALIVGDGAQRGALERLATSLGVAEAVHFAGTLEQTHTALSLMDVFVFLPAEQEGFGLSLLEAMASARPIVAVRRGVGAVWVLEESRVGTLVEPGDPSRLAGAVARYLQDKDMARRAADDARRVVKERFSLSRMIDQVEAVYDELASR